ncbi:MAG: PH domain-containing protein [Limisphaerales bacterium]
MHPPRRDFTAPWGRSVKILTPVAVGIIALLAAGQILAAQLVPTVPKWVFALGLVVPVAALVVTALCAVRGYRVDAVQDALVILRPGRETALPLAGLEGAEVRPDAFRGVYMKAGSAGFFGYLGWFRSRALGSFRAWVTDPALSVLLRFPGRQIVVSPDDPAAFIAALEGLRGRRAPH